MGLYLGGLIIGRIFTSEIWGAYFQEGLYLGEGGGYYRNFMVFQLQKSRNLLLPFKIRTFILLGKRFI